MKLTFGVLLTILALATAERDWTKVFPRHLPNPAGARIPHGIPSPRITGGAEAPPHSIPYQVAVLTPVSGGNAFCGGTLITNRFVLTAAHCVEGALGPVEVILGAHRITEDESSQVRVFSSHIVIHSGWSSLLLRNDIALVGLPNPIVFNENIQPINLADDPTNSFEGHSAHASGWGLDSDSSNTISPVLRVVDVPIISNDVCNIPFFGIIQETHICASGLGGKSTCSGDSGGPLVVAGIQVGIVSFGIALGCEIGWPAAFTRVSSYIDWINTYVNV